MSALVHHATQLTLAAARNALPALRRSLEPDTVDTLFCAILAAQWETASEILTPVIAEDVERPEGDIGALLDLLCVIVEAAEVAPVAPNPPPAPGPAELAELLAWTPEAGRSEEEITEHLEHWPEVPPTMPGQLDHETA